MATHSSVLAWRIPGTGEPGGLPSMGSQRVGHDWSDLAEVAAACSFYFCFLESFDHKWMLKFVKGFLCIYWDNHMAFIFQFVNVVYDIDWFADIEESLHPWDKAHLVMMYDLFMIFFFPNCLSGRCPLSSSFVWFGGHLSCSFTCWVFLCLFILFILLCLGWRFCILAVCGVLFIVAFPHCVWVCTGGLSRFPV